MNITKPAVVIKYEDPLSALAVKKYTQQQKQTKMLSRPKVIFHTDFYSFSFLLLNKQVTKIAAVSALYTFHPQ